MPARINQSIQPARRPSLQHGIAQRFLAHGNQRKLELARHLLDGGPLRVVDVGSLGGLQEELRPALELIEAIAFDPNHDDCARLNAAAAEAGHRHRFEPYVVGGEDGERPFYVCRKVSSSSLLRPNREFHSAFSAADRMDVTRVDRVHTREFGRVLRMVDARPEYLKLDAHGIERDLLESLSASQWTGLLAVFTEVLFAPLFIGQGEFGELDATLRERGFRMYQLRRFSGRRAILDPRCSVSRGQLLFGDALYLRSPADVDDDQRRRLALVALLFNHYDLAIDLLRDDPVLARQVEELAGRPRAIRILGIALHLVGRIGGLIGGSPPGFWASDSPFEWS